MIFPVSNLPMSSSGSEDKEWRVGESSFLMPGFRFHPTEEELVEFYLRRKVEGKHFNIELIASVDLYGYDPWELPALAFTGEKEWYFYVQRDRKYRNGDRPNRVTKSGYWKATGADRMIHNEVSRCIGLKKSLVFYKGKAPKGKRTSWIMNEYRLPKLENQRMPEELITGVKWLVESIKIYDKRKERVGTNEDRLPKLESQRTHESELCLCRVYRKSRGSEEGFQQAKERHMKIENHEDQEMHQCQTCMPCSNPRTTGEFCNLGINEVGKDEIVNLENLPTNIKIIPKPLTEEERFRAHMEYGVRETMEYDVPDQSKIQERIYSEGGNVWSTPCGSTALNEDLELYLTACLMCPRAPDQLAMSEGLYADNPSNLVLNNALTYGACMPNYSDKLWEWNPVRDDGNGASC